MHDPRDPHFFALKRILRYVCGTIDHGLQLHVSSTAQLTAYIDADWAGCPVTRRSTSGYCVFLGDNLLSWSAKRHVTLSRSSAEAEYRGVANVVAETAWLRNLLLELHAPLSTAIIVYCDNVSAVIAVINDNQEINEPSNADFTNSNNLVHDACHTHVIGPFRPTAQEIPSNVQQQQQQQPTQSHRSKETRNNRHQATGNRQQATCNRKQTGKRKQETGNRQQATGNRQQATGNRQQATGNRQQATGNRQQATCNRQHATRNT
ncbi:ribonuclease H-like domain-containing protein [Tanacetum coccineum]